MSWIACMSRRSFSLALVFGSTLVAGVILGPQSSYAACQNIPGAPPCPGTPTEISGFPPRMLYVSDGLPVFVDYNTLKLRPFPSNAAFVPAQIIRVTPVSPIPARGRLQVASTGRGVSYIPAPGTQRGVDRFTVRLEIDGRIVYEDYTVNILPAAELLELLRIPAFDIPVAGGRGTFLISAFDRATGTSLQAADLSITFPTTPDVGALHGDVFLTPRTGRNDIFDYVADPGYVGFDDFLVIVRDRSGRMGYQWLTVTINP